MAEMAKDFITSEEDLAEMNNLWNEYPEVVDRLSKMLDEWDASGRSRL